MPRLPWWTCHRPARLPSPRARGEPSGQGRVLRLTAETGASVRQLPQQRQLASLRARDARFERDCGILLAAEPSPVGGQPVMTPSQVSRAHLPVSGWTLEVDESRHVFRLGRPDCWSTVDPRQEHETWGDLPSTWLAAFMSPAEGDREGWVLAYGALQAEGEVAAFVGTADVAEGPDGDWWQVPVLTVGHSFWLAEYENNWLALAITQGRSRKVFHRRVRHLR